MKKEKEFKFPKDWDKKKGFNFIKDLRKAIITEHELQNMKCIELSGSRELVPFELVETSFKEFIKRLKVEFKGKQFYYKGKDIWEKIDKLVGDI